MRLINSEKTEEILAGDHTRLKEVLHPDKQSFELPYSLALARIEPGKESLPHRLKSKEVYIFLYGSGVFHLENESFEVNAGKIVVVHEHQKQFVVNNGGTDLTFYCIVSPPWTEDGESVMHGQ